MTVRAWIGFGALAAAVGLYVYSRTDSGTNVVGGLVDKITSTIRGIRNNNPTNMIDAGIPWDGMTGTDANGFCVFATLPDGITAAKKNLRSYWRLHGINTVDGICRRWSATDQDAYVANVSAYLGVDPQDSLDMEDDGVRTQLVRGMSRQEDGAVGELLVDNQIVALQGNV